MTPGALVFLDTETTSLQPNREAWEIGMICRTEYGETEHHLFVDVDLTWADPEALEIGRFTERFPFDDAVSRETAAATVATVTAGAVIVGSNPHFDVATLEPLLREFGWQPTWHYRPLCAATMAAGYLAAASSDDRRQQLGIDDGRYRSYNVSRALGIEPPSAAEAHTALGDAAWTMRLFDRITGAGQ